MKSNIIQEFKGYINNVPFDNHNLYYSVEYILNEIESTFDLDVPFTLVRDMKYALQSAFDDISETTQGEIETEIADCIHNASSIDDLEIDSYCIHPRYFDTINKKLKDWDNTYGKDPIMFDFNNNTL